MSITTASVPTNGQTLVRAVFRDGNNNIIRVAPGVVTWTTSNASVATVTSPFDFVRLNYDRAFIVGVAAGTATITAACNGFSSIVITVTVYSPAATTMEVDLQPSRGASLNYPTPYDPTQGMMG